MFLLNRREENALSQAMADNNARTIDLSLIHISSEKEEREAAELVRRAGCRTERHPDGSVCYSWQGVEVEHHTRLFDLHNPCLLYTSRCV